MAASALLKNTLKKTSLRLNTVTYKEKMFLGTTTLDESFLFFTKLFMHLSVIAAACYFNVYKLIEWDPLNLYLFKVISRNTNKRGGICPKLTINTVVLVSFLLTLSMFHNFFSNVSIVNFEQVNFFLV